MGSQPFLFPLYNGAAPSVPPRHQNQHQQQQHQQLNNIPSRESAFKRLEQQQQLHLKQQQKQNGLSQHIQQLQLQQHVT